MKHFIFQGTNLDLGKNRGMLYILIDIKTTQKRNLYGMWMANVRKAS